jgi:glutaminyl-tRNA synthetase
LYDRLFTIADPDSAPDFKSVLNPESLIVVHDAFVERSIQNDPPGTRYQFERVGYFTTDMEESTAGRLIFNRTVTLRDSFVKKNVDEGRPIREKPAPKRQTAPTPDRLTALTPKGEQYVKQHGLDRADAALLTRDADTAEYFEDAIDDAANVKQIAKWIINLGTAIRPKDLVSLVALVEDGTISSTGAKEVYAEIAKSGGDPADVVERLGLRQISDSSAIQPIVDEIVANHADKANAYRSGRTGMLGFFVGQVMSKTGGRANPELVKQLVEKSLA